MINENEEFEFDNLYNLSDEDIKNFESGENSSQLIPTFSQAETQQIEPITLKRRRLDSSHLGFCFT